VQAPGVWCSRRPERGRGPGRRNTPPRPRMRPDGEKGTCGRAVAVVPAGVTSPVRTEAPGASTNETAVQKAQPPPGQRTGRSRRKEAHRRPGEGFEREEAASSEEPGASAVHLPCDSSPNRRWHPAPVFWPSKTEDQTAMFPRTSTPVTFAKVRTNVSNHRLVRDRQLDNRCGRRHAVGQGADGKPPRDGTPRMTKSPRP
jgi:hypothetical protein